EELVHIYSNHTTRPSFLVVVNNNKEMKGIIYASELMKVAVDEAEEDILQLGGISKSDGIANSIIGTVKTRLPWLCISFCAINLSSFVLGLFQDVLESNIYLAILMPVVAAMGGNAGLQASTIAVNAIATNSHNNLGILRTVFKELTVGFINGVVLSIFIAAIVYFRYNDYYISFIMAISIILVFTFATLFGSIIPILINKLKLDPSLSSSVMTSSCSDIIGFVSLFMTAKIILM
ncbi:MAG: magnesium transporter, partial [Candidatus Heimdallarchaeota archaeon]|nr:magnesium transporter [Candidatus Heimdallarchaeota archaeon]